MKKILNFFSRESCVSKNNKLTKSNILTISRNRKKLPYINKSDMRKLTNIYKDKIC